MSEDALIGVGLVISVVMAYVIGSLARRKGYPYGLWVLNGFLLWPVALGVILLLRDKTKRECPDCGSRVPFNAPVCRHCGHDVRTRKNAPTRPGG